MGKTEKPGGPGKKAPAAKPKLRNAKSLGNVRHIRSSHGISQISTPKTIVKPVVE